MKANPGTLGGNVSDKKREYITDQAIHPTGVRFTEQKMVEKSMTSSPHRGETPYSLKSET